MMNLVEEIREVISGFSAHDLTGGASLNLGEIHAGDRPNRVPDLCVSRIDIRFPPPATNAEVFAAAAAVIDAHDWASYQVEKRGETLETPSSSPLVGAIQDSARSCGREPRIGGLRGWTEAEPFRTMLGIDAVVLGPGFIEQAHCAREFVSIPETQLAAIHYADIARRLLV